VSLPCVLPGPGDWTLKAASLYTNIFIVATNPEQKPRLVGRTASGQLFTRLLTPSEAEMAT